jgi:hypothetical protein
LTYIPFRLDDVVFSDYERFKEHFRYRGLGRVWRLYRPLPPDEVLRGYFAEVRRVKDMGEGLTEEKEREVWKGVLPRLVGLREVWMWNGTNFHVESNTVRDLARTLVEKTPFDGTGCCLWPDGRYPGTGMQGAKAIMGGLEAMRETEVKVVGLHVGPVDWEWLLEVPKLSGLLRGLTVLDLQL